MTGHRQGLTPGEAWRKYDDVEARLTGGVSERMLDLAQIKPGMYVLDLASGRGEPALRAAERVGRAGFVRGIDTAEDVLALAREAAKEKGLSNIELTAGDATSILGIAPGTFDVATARWGLMYMSAPERALAETHRALKPGGVLVAALWAEPERCPWSSMPRGVLSRYCDLPRRDPKAPGPFRYGEVASIEHDLAQAGFSIELVEELELPVIETESGEAIVEWVRDLGFARPIDTLPEETQAAFERELAKEAEQHRTGNVIQLGGVTRLVVGRKAP